MKLLHWNVHMWRDGDGRDNKQAVADLIDHVAPDVVSLVEVDEPWGQPDRLGALAADLGYRSVYVPAFEYGQAGGFGNALLARPKIDTVQQWQLLPPMLYAGDEPSEPRAVVVARVADDPGWWVGSTHLPRLDPNMRAQASARLLQIVDGLTAPWIVCGDFNQPSTAWLPTWTVVAPNPPVATYPACSPVEAIDYCVFGGATATADVLASDASDHRPLVVVASATSSPPAAG